MTTRVSRRKNAHIYTNYQLLFTSLFLRDCVPYSSIFLPRPWYFRRLWVRQRKSWENSRRDEVFLRCLFPVL